MLLSYLSVNYCLTTPLNSWDGAAYASGASFVLRGQLPYIDFFDHKPPGIFILDSLAFVFFGVNGASIRILQLLFALIAAPLVFCLTNHLVKFRAIALVVTIQFLQLFYLPSIYEDGNQVTEYGSIFALSGIAALLFAQSKNHVGFRWFGVGLLLGVPQLFKEPYVLTTLPWVAWGAWLLRQKNRRHSRGLLILGYVSPLLLIALFYYYSDGGAAALDVLSYNLHYTTIDSGTLEPVTFSRKLFQTWQGLESRVLSSSRLWVLIAVLGLASAFDPAFEREHSGLPLVIATCFVLTFLAITLSGRAFGHYYLQLVPIYILTGCSGLRWLFHTKIVGRFSRNRLAILFPALFFMTNWTNLSLWVERFAWIAHVEPHRSALAEYILVHKAADDTIWAPSVTQPDVQLYFETASISPTRYFYLFKHILLDTYLSSAQGKKLRLKADLLSNPPRFIVVDNPKVTLDFLGDVGIPDWILSNYDLQRVGERSVYELHKRSLGS